jgi:hypothetical protein
MGRTLERGECRTASLPCPKKGSQTCRRCPIDTAPNIQRFQNLILQLQSTKVVRITLKDCKTSLVGCAH